MRKARVSVVCVVLLAQALGGCSSWVKVEVPAPSNVQAQAIELKAGTHVRIVLADGREVERRVSAVDATGVEVIPRYYRDTPVERYAYADIRSIERHSAGGFFGTVGVGYVVLAIVLSLVLAGGAGFPPP